jgi:dihydrofolate reductase
MSQGNSPEVVLIAALGRNRELGKDGQLIWHIPGDLPRFKAITMGYPLVMGRKTFESIGRPLPGRTNVVLSRQPEWRADGVVKVNSVQDALEVVRSEEAERMFVIGGAEVYELFLGIAERLELTLVDQTSASADVFFPDYTGMGFRLASSLPGTSGELPHEYVTLIRDDGL